MTARLLAGIERGGSRRVAVTRVLATPQARQAEVENVFEKLLDREPTASELRRFLAAGGFDQIVVMRRVLAGREFFEAQGGTNAGFVDAIALKLLGRPATATETARWMGLLDRGGSRSLSWRTFCAARPSCGDRPSGSHGW